MKQINKIITNKTTTTTNNKNRKQHIFKTLFQKVMFCKQQTQQLIYDLKSSSYTQKVLINISLWNDNIQVGLGWWEKSWTSNIDRCIEPEAKLVPI